MNVFSLLGSWCLYNNVLQQILHWKQLLRPLDNHCPACRDLYSKSFSFFLCNYAKQCCGHTFSTTSFGWMKQPALMLNGKVCSCKNWKYGSAL